MFDFSRIVRALGLTVGIAAGAAGMGAMAAIRRPLPRISGSLPLTGLTSRAIVRRDRWGVPHISAESNADLFAALGYVHAQDRLWQMELNRRTGHGRLAEIFGPIALSSDQFVRTLGFSRVARREVDLLDDETRAIVEAYVRGVNACVEALRGRLPLEFAILGFQPRPWEVVDILVWPKIMSLNLSGNWMSELFNAHVVAAVGVERAAAIAPCYPGEAAITVPPGTAYSIHMGDAALRMAAEAGPFTGDTGGPQGSNAWVVSGRHTASGRPLLAGDPHLGLGLPGLWYAAHLEGGEFHAAGVTMPGTCGIVIGHNRRVAWGVTNAMTDNQDLYIERFHPENPDLYEWRGEWREVELVREEIVVKGQKEVVLVDVRLSHHGPIIDEVSGPESSPLRGPRDEGRRTKDQGQPASEGLVAAGPGGPSPFAADPSSHTALALRWTALDPSPALTRAVLRLNRAHDWVSFRAALSDWDVPPQNFVYADVDGHIGYALAGKLPVRERGDGQLPVPGWSGEYEWRGFIPHDGLPASLDPPGGAIVTANNRLVGPDYPYHDALHGEYANPYRAERIAALLAASDAHDARSFARIQTDVRSLPGLQLASLVADLDLADPTERGARDLLVAWDGALTPDSAAGAFYDILRYHLPRVAYAELEPLIGATAALGAFGGTPSNFYLERVLPELLARIAAAPAPERPDPWLGEGRTWSGVLREAVGRAVADLRERQGAAPARWSYGKGHSLTLRHPLGGVPALASVFNRGPWPTGGDLDTVSQNYIPRDTATGYFYNAASYRQILDPGDWDSARVILPAGQSGHPGSSHYADMAAAWRAGGYFPLLWTPEAIERHTVETLTLAAPTG
ncbi:MAG: penicillin acylase family protein [Chloroflexales bacterium]|nr:penicillin acylase family protein [Chloroflexales bacterium]